MRKPIEEQPPCECPGPGFCHRYQIAQQEHAWRICSGNCNEKSPCTPELSNRYRAKWARRLAQLAGDGPGLLRQIANATKAAGRVALAAVRREPILAPPEIAAQREAICNTCDLMKEGRCRHASCGCPINRLLRGKHRPGKVEIASQRCPMGKWDRWKDEG